MREILANCWRRRFRTGLTIMGILVGVLALTVLGGMAEKINMMMAGGERYFSGQITVSPGGFGGVQFLTAQQIEVVRETPGVESVLPLVRTLIDGAGGLSFGIPPMIQGVDLHTEFQNRNWDRLELAKGRPLQRGDRMHVVVGVEIAHERKVDIGDQITLYGREYEVVGIAARTMTGPDQFVFMPLEEARELLVESIPFLQAINEQAQQLALLGQMPLAFLPPEFLETLGAGVDPFNLATEMAVSWVEGEDPERVALRIRERLPGVSVFSPEDMRRGMANASIVFNLIILGSASIALLVGGLSVINTMTMTVMERTREIGVKKALGATPTHILREILAESLFMGLMGGLLGLGLGKMIIDLINWLTTSTGVQIFALTPRLAIGTVLFSTLLSGLAGLLPALRAARLDAVQALKEV